MTRYEHLKWCKERAILEMDYYSDPHKALISMASDLRKHPETDDQVLIGLCTAQLLLVPDMSREEVIQFLNDFN